jgi:hypothetical protein
MKAETKQSAEWMDLQSLTHYADISVRTVSDWIRDPIDPLPASRVRGKILVHRPKFDAYLEQHSLKPSSFVDEILKELDNA